MWYGRPMSKIPAGFRVDSNRVAMAGARANVFTTQDAADTPITSPVTVNTTQTLKVPQGATSMLICSATNPVQVSEDSTQSAFLTIPANIPMNVDCADQQFVYLKTSVSTVVSFLFKIV